MLAQPHEPGGPVAADDARARRPRAPASTPRSTRSPSLPSSAGSTVSEPTSDVKTTIIAPMPIEVKIFEPAKQHAGHRDQHGARRR